MAKISGLLQQSFAPSVRTCTHRRPPAWEARSPGIPPDSRGSSRTRASAECGWTTGRSGHWEKSRVTDCTETDSATQKPPQSHRYEQFIANMFCGLIMDRCYCSGVYLSCRWDQCWATRLEVKSDFFFMPDLIFLKRN